MELNLRKLNKKIEGSKFSKTEFAYFLLINLVQT